MRHYYRHPGNGSTLFHERLAIMDLVCFQPIEGSAPTRQVVHNGEIYNHVALKKQYLPEITNKTTCDSEVIIQLYDKFRGKELCNMLDGVFAIALIYDDEFFAARDPIGVKPLYYGLDGEGRFYCAWVYWILVLGK
jgi:asparagine synthase (glutamine-hydrolysing)